MADIREPAAWVNSARMSGAFYMYVEGDSDERFWNKFIDSSRVRIQVCHGKNKVLDVVEKHEEEDVRSFIAVVDRDFGAITGNLPHHINLFVTDDHDLEMMIYHKGNAYQELLNAIDRGGKIKAYEKSNPDLLAETLTITNDIGYCKLAAYNNRFVLEFAKEDLNSHDIVRPKYEDTIDVRTGNYLGVERVVSKIIGFTISCKKKPPKDIIVLEKVKEEKATLYDSWQLSNGHDVSCILPVLIRRRCMHKHNNIDSEYIDSVLCAAYSKDDLKMTDLYAEMIKWSEENNYILFK